MASDKDTRPHQRTLIGEYASYQNARGERERHPAGTRLFFNEQQLKRAIEAGVVHADEKLDAEVPVKPPLNDPQGQLADEQTGSGPAPDARNAPARRGGRYSQSRAK